MLPSAVVQLLPTPRASEADHPGRTSANHAGQTGLAEVVNNLLPTPVADNSRGLTSDGTDYQSLPNEVAYRFGQYAAAIARHEQAFGRPAPAPTEPGRNGKPRLSAAFTEWMMGLPDGWITDVPDTTRNEALKLCGNGVVPAQCEAALRDMLTAMQQEVAA